MGNNNETWFGSVIIILVFCWIFSGYFSSTRTVVAYTASCIPSSELVNGNCNGKSYSSVKTYFSVNKDKQEVVSHTNQSGDTPIKYKNCTIADEKNWTCEYPDSQTGSPDIGFSNGNFTALGKVAESDKELGIYYVSAFRWWLMEFGLGRGQSTTQTVNISSTNNTSPTQTVNIPSTNTISPTTNINDNSSNDPFPFDNNKCDASGCPQYEWYDRHNVPMSNRCYPGMTSACSKSEWEQALGSPLTPQEQEALQLK